MNPPATETTFAELIRRCAPEDDNSNKRVGNNSDWETLLDRTRVWVRNVFLCYSQWNYLVDEFEDWFFGWLASGRRLRTQLNALRRAWQQPECVHIPARESAARNYFRTIIESGRAAYLREVSTRLPVAPDVDPDTTPGHNPGQAITEQLETAEQWEQVRAVVCQLPQRHRIPFWLRYRARLGPLLTADEQYLRALHEHNIGWLEDQLLTFENGNAPAIAIATVLGLNAAYVYTLQHEARNWIREQLGPPN